MKTKLTIAIVVALGTVFFAGCASAPKRQLSALQGTWVGQEVQGPAGECRMTVAGDSLKFKGAREQEWYSGTLMIQPGSKPTRVDVVIQDCPAPQYIKKTAKGIYKIEGKTLTIAANEPGSEAVPTGFERGPGSQSRVFVFTRQ